MVFSAVEQYFTVAGVSWLGWYMRRRLEDATQDVKKAQNETLMARIRENENTEYGQRFKFPEIKNREDFVSLHPLTRYKHYEEYIERMMKGETNILTKEQPVIFAVTSGTSGKSSVIPMIKKQQSLFFTHGITVVFDCIRKAFPGSNSLQKDMKFFYTPRLRTSECGIQIGPNSSSPANSKKILNMYSTPLPGYEILSEPEALYAHLLFGLKDKNLGIIEANFASLVYSGFRAMESEWNNLVNDIEIGKVKEDLKIDDKIRDDLNKIMKPDPKRAEELRQARNQGLESVSKRIWPNLHFVMTADSGTFEHYGQRLRDIYCKGTPIYSPLYAASEGLLGINIWPLERPSRYVLQPNSMFFELIPIEECEEDQPKTVFLEDAKVDQVYELVITNASGLYRYRFGDVIKVVGFHNTCPVIEFQYRYRFEDVTVDFHYSCPLIEFQFRQGQFLNVRGEKTSEAAFYQAVCNAVQKSTLNLVDYCCTESVMVDKSKKGKGDKVPCYHVFIEVEQGDKTPASFPVDEELRTLSYVYSSFRRKGSIGAMKVYVVKPGTFSDLRAYMIDTTTGSPNQYKVPRVLKKSEAVDFIIDRIETCLL